MQGTCKAAVWCGERDIRVMEVKLPKCGDDGMIIKVNATSICGTDLHVYTHSPQVPTILGHEICGTIVEMGKNADKTIKCFTGKLEVGDRINLYPWITCGTCSNCLEYGIGASGLCDHSFVYGLPYEELGLGGTAARSASIEEEPYIKGGFSEYMYVFPGTFVWKVPDDMPSSVASLLDPMSVAMRSVEMAQRCPGVFEDSLNLKSTVFINGDGQIGALTAACARALGVKNIIISGGRKERLELAKKISDADCILNYHEQSVEERKEIVKAYTDGRGADVVFQCAGNASAFREAIEFLKPVGTFVEVGNIAESNPTTFDPARDLCCKHATYLGMSVNTPGAFHKGYQMLLKWKELHLEELFTHRCTLETLLQTMEDSRNPLYMKGYVEF